MSAKIVVINTILILCFTFWTFEEIGNEMRSSYPMRRKDLSNFRKVAIKCAVIFVAYGSHTQLIIIFNVRELIVVWHQAQVHLTRA